MKVNDHVSRYEEIAYLIAKRIVKGEFKKDDKLRGRSLLSSEYNVSSETIRKAMQLLSNYQVVSVKERSGIYVSDQNHAKDYVRDFIADVDRSRILKVRSIMRKVKHSLSPSATIDEALAFMEEKEIDSIYITDDKNLLLGIVLKEDLEKTRNKTVKALIKTENYQPVLRNSYIKDVLKDLKESDHDIPVTDSKGRLRGVLGYDDVIDALAE
ncbi:MAG: CBS domain-containing protein [Acholeplasmataceae bacterium]